jgi:hypothetical protein
VKALFDIYIGQRKQKTLNMAPNKPHLTIHMVHVSLTVLVFYTPASFFNLEQKIYTDSKLFLPRGHGEETYICTVVALCEQLMTSYNQSASGIFVPHRISINYQPPTRVTRIYRRCALSGKQRSDDNEASMMTSGISRFVRRSVLQRCS